MIKRIHHLQNFIKDMNDNSFSLDTDSFLNRHLGPNKDEVNEMLDVVGATDLGEFIDQVLPESISLEKDLELPTPSSEYSLLKHLRMLEADNKVFKSYIGLGYYNCITPPVIQRNIFENPGWYTQYTPYQSEISQGRLEALINFQTVIADLTGMEIANASLLDEGTAAAEAMTLLHRVRVGNKKDSNTLFVSKNCFPQTIEILKTRAKPLGIELIIDDDKNFDFNDRYFGAIFQQIDSNGEVNDYQGIIDEAHSKDILVAVIADLLSLAILKPPGEIGVDVVVGSTQRLGVPMGYGGPHAAYFATREEYKRQVPGRIIGVSVDSGGRLAYRMALQTREQHIRREKATSNICTAQSLLAIMAGMYVVYHGPEGLKRIANRIRSLAYVLKSGLSNLGYPICNTNYFDTLKIDTSTVSDNSLSEIKKLAERNKINFRYTNDQCICISIDETTGLKDIENIFSIFSSVIKKDRVNVEIEILNIENIPDYAENLKRTTGFLNHSVFNRYHSETKLLRYIKRLESKDLSLTTSMIPLGSCTMKLNSTAEMQALSWPGFSDLHPFVPEEQARGYREIINELENFLSQISGLSACSLQPNSGAQGEYAGLLVIRAYFEDRGEGHRDIALIPSSAHGTNPASASMAGMKIVIVKCDERGNIDIEDLRSKAESNSDNLAVLMVTYPSTHGVFEEDIKEICSIVHENGGQVYMDGANLNAQVGLTSPGRIGADVCHINLHKTFSIPHGGGGPGMGPICVAKHLEPFLPRHILANVGGEKGISAVSSTPWGSSSILIISYSYIKLLGSKGVAEATKVAILNANYIKSRLEKYFDILYVGKNNRVAHEFILDLRRFKKESGVDVEDIAKRLMDYGFHAPTISWPVPGTMMIEPTESEDKAELDRFCDAMIEVFNEIQEIADGKADKMDNVLKNAPHTSLELANDKWQHSYSIKKAYYPVDYLQTSKFWPPVGRIDNTYGDKNLVCTCTSVEDFKD